MKKLLSLRLLILSHQRKMCDMNRFSVYDGWYQKAPKEKADSVTALVLGWAGAQPRQVQKFTQMYAEEFGIGAHGYIMPMEYCFRYDQKGQRQLADYIVQNVLPNENTGKKILLHCFSNNGFNLCKQVALSLKENTDKLEILGCVIDSAPGPLGVFPYFSQKWGVHDKITKDAPWIFPLFTPIIYGYFEVTEHKNSILASVLKALQITPVLYFNWLKFGSNEWAGNYLMHKEDEHWPLLFIYSVNDKLMPHTYVDRLIVSKRRQSPNRLIVGKKFTKSGHVAHHKTFPQEYVHQIAQFIVKSKL